ncbi:flagellar basal body-associated FliL family protein [Rhodosalinus sp. 5P4]|uniref:flagellar basal body-associated FliL family protein n=1 Tax=Rhodosalinus sp. 5P4 TaxID=3239196 RepID=UPI0035254C7C
MRKLLPVLMAVAGLAAGVGAGYAFRPTSEPGVDAETAENAESAAGTLDEAPPPGERDYVRLDQQFVVPVLEEGRVAAMVVLAIGLEAMPGAGEAIFAREPKLRDTLLQVMFDHANVGGFAGAFTDTAALDPLRRQLTEAARRIMPGTIDQVLIVEMARQDL